MEHRPNLTWFDHGTITGSRKMGHCLLSGNYLRYFSQATRVRVYQEYINYGQTSEACENRVSTNDSRTVLLATDKDGNEPNDENWKLQNKSKMKIIIIKKNLIVKCSVYK